MEFTATATERRRRARGEKKKSGGASFSKEEKKRKMMTRRGGHVVDRYVFDVVGPMDLGEVGVLRGLHGEWRCQPDEACAVTFSHDQNTPLHSPATASCGMERRKWVRAFRAITLAKVP